MKKIIALLLSLTMVLSMAACGSSDSASAASQKEAASTAASGGETAGSETAAIPGLEDGVFTIAMECAMRRQLEPDRRQQRRCSHQGLQ